MYIHLVVLEMVLRDLPILLFISEWAVLVGFCHAFCVTSGTTVECNSVTELSDSYFNRSVEKQDVQVLLIENNYSELAIDPPAFRSFTNLKTVIVEKSKIRRIFGGTFKDSPLESLVISHNGIEKIYPVAFHNLPSLQNLLITNNSLTTIHRGVFKDLPRLRLLTLSTNEIATIEDGALENVPKLEVLKLEDNKIETIVIHKVVSHPEMLKVLWLDDNSLSSVTGYMLEKLTNLTLLKLASNKISTIEENAFGQTPSLKILELNRNKLKVVDGIFPSEGLVNLRILRLDYNELMFLSQSFFSGLDSLNTISLYENPWKCACLDSTIRILSKNGVNNKCQKVYSTGRLPLCVTRDASNKYCSYTYDSELLDIYMNYKKTYPVVVEPLFCFMHRI